MELPVDFHFSQGALQDFSDCKRRFLLRYVKELAWPAIVADPALEHERHLQLGIQFHRLVQQHQIGIPADSLSPLAQGALELDQWWQNYLRFGPQGLPSLRYPEMALSAPLGNHRLVAKFDLIALEPGKRAVIVDWKTSKKPKKTWLAQRLQTRVYRYLLVQSGVHLNDGKLLKPEQVEMVYWFAAEPQAPERFPYDRKQFDEDEAFLLELVQQIEQLNEEGFTLTSDERHCRFCAYRSLCERGVQAGAAGPDDEAVEPEGSLDLELSLEQIGEISF